MGAIFDFSTFPVIATERLRLRQLTHADADGLMALFNSPDVLRYLNDSPIENHEKAIEYIDWLNRSYENHSSIEWAIALPETDAMIGMTGFYSWEHDNRRADIGYALLPAYWGHGYATEATRALVAWCFDNLNLHRIQADCTDGNSASEKVLLKCGFKVEGIWRESCWEHGRFVDIKQFGLLYREFEYR